MVQVFSSTWCAYLTPTTKSQNKKTGKFNFHLTNVTCNTGNIKNYTYNAREHSKRKAWSKTLSFYNSILVIKSKKERGIRETLHKPERLYIPSDFEGEGKIFEIFSRKFQIYTKKQSLKTNARYQFFICI